MDLPERRKRGRPQRKFINVVKDDIQRVEWDRVRWKQMICCGDP